MFLLFLFGAIIALYFYLSSGFQYWKKRNVPNPEPSLLFGNLGDSLTSKRSVGQIYTDIYRDFPDVLYVGFYRGRQPGLVLRDPQLIRDVMNKDFNSFHDNDLIISEEVDPLGGRNTFSLKGEKWKTAKSLITPCFTAKKMREMHVFLQKAANRMVRYLDDDVLKGGGSLEVRELFAQFGTEVVANCAFGLEGRTFDEPDPLFRKMGKKLFEPSPLTVIKFSIMFMFPSLSNILKIRFIPKDVTEYFCNIVDATLNYRKENNIVRNDFLDSMLELKNKLGESKFTNTDVTAQAVGFFTDGFETSSCVIAFALYELAANPEILNRLRAEVDQALLMQKELDYDSVHGLKYLDAVICETVRLHPPALVLLRSCTKPFVFPPPRGQGTGKDVNVEVDTPIMIPLYGLHTDPKYFKDPYVFDPERFMGENKESIVRGAYLPFGDGPRACHGQRFGATQAKVALINILANFDVTVNERTKTPLEIDPRYLILHVKGGLWINFSRRTSK
ncbi:hypothetical protein PPYR_05703 [Photinus pyralis]|uniref:Cytochrome P450 n=1 Tax=Photinus pyralis TaxID=7054 RepID=A0A1Y1MRQ2_PHOPY|nr:cytochrome P450 6k1-like [Photinus pyralis]KAB0801349.1 hypothetical protein PPYR_05703 [Photinus pyralis]